MPAAGAPPASPPAEPQWRRLHPVTPAVRGWKVLAVLAAIAVQQVGTNIGEARDLVDGAGWGVVAAVVGGALVVGFVYAALAWRMSRYALDAEAVYLHTGVLFRRQRTARLDRVQAVDVVQPLLARLLGLAELRIEVAGGNDSAVQLAFLREDEAQALRNTLLARAAGVPLASPEEPAPAAPERELLVVPPGRLVASLARSLSVVLLAVGLVALLVSAVVFRAGEIVLSALPGILGVGGYLWQRFAGEFAFRAAQSPDGIRLRHGLLEQRSQTLPPGRVQAVRLTQGPLWRGPDWWRVDVNVAGYGATAENKVTETVLLPVGSREEALLALWLVVPDLGAPDPRAVLDAGLVGDGTDGGFVTSPRPARWLDPWAYRRTGYLLTEHAVLIRTGRFVRRLVVVPHARIQSVGLTQGPLQRRLGVATVALHSTAGSITPQVPHLEAHVAGALVDTQAERSRTARATAGPERWMSAVAATAAVQEATPAPLPPAPPFSAAPNAAPPPPVGTVPPAPAGPPPPPVTALPPAPAGPPPPPEAAP